MSETPRFSSLIVSRPRRRLFRIAPVAALLLALSVHLATALALLISHFLFIEVMQPAQLVANDDPPFVIKLPRQVTGGASSAEPARFGVPQPAGGREESARDAAVRSRPAVTQPDPLAPPAAFVPREELRTGVGTGHGSSSGFVGNDAFPDGNCLSDCGDGPGNRPGFADGPPDGVYQEGDPRLHLPMIIEASRILPAYPDIARRAHVQGSVLLRIIVRADGTVGVIEVLRSPDPRLGFDLAAIEAVKQWRYEPARLGALPVAVQLSVMVEFVISR